MLACIEINMLKVLACLVHRELALWLLYWSPLECCLWLFGRLLIKCLPSVYQVPMLCLDQCYSYALPNVLISNYIFLGVTTSTSTSSCAPLDLNLLYTGTWSYAWLVISDRNHSFFWKQSHHICLHYSSEINYYFAISFLFLTHDGASDASLESKHGRVYLTALVSLLKTMPMLEAINPTWLWFRRKLISKQANVKWSFVFLANPHVIPISYRKDQTLGSYLVLRYAWTRWDQPNKCIATAAGSSWLTGFLGQGHCCIDQQCSLWWALQQFAFVLLCYSKGHRKCSLCSRHLGGNCWAMAQCELLQA